MTAKEEDILTSVTLIENGVALERLLESVIVNKAINPSSLLVGDRNAIIIAARVSGYGNMYRTSITCPNCITEQKHSFDLNNAKITTASDIAAELPDVINISDTGAYIVTLPKSQLVIEMALLNGIDERSLTDKIVDSNNKDSQRLITTQLTHMIKSVNGNSTQEAIEYVSQNLPSGDSAFLRKIYTKIVPNVELTLGFTCQHCGHSEEMEVPLAAEFFWPDA